MMRHVERINSVLLQAPRPIYRAVVGILIGAVVLAGRLVVVADNPGLKILMAIDLLILIVFGYSHFVYRRVH